MSLQDNLMAEIKTAMKAKDTVSLTVLRAIKAEFLKLKTSGGDVNITEADEIALLTKMAKQRNDAAAIYVDQKRDDLAKDELDQVEVIMKYLPKQLTESELQEEISALVNQVGASGPKDMGKVMGMASKKLAGKAEGKAIAAMVKTVLQSL